MLVFASVGSGACGPTGPATSPVPPTSPLPTTATVPPTRLPTPAPSPSPRPTARSTAPPQPTWSTAGQVLLDEANTDRYTWEAGAILHPHGLVVLGGTAYLVDAGQLVAISLADGQARRLFPADGRIEDIPVGEIFTLAPGPQEASLILLDKRGDLYRYDIPTDRWSVERPIDRRRAVPNPVPYAIASYSGRAYILDSNYSQVWRYPFQDVAEGYLPGGDAPANRAGTAFDITRGIDLAVERDVYVLLREGHGGPAGLRRFVGAPPQRDPGFAPDLELEKPTRLYLEPGDQGRLYVLDREGQRLQALDRQTGVVQQTFAFSEGPVEMRAVCSSAGRLFIATPAALYLYPGTGQVHTVAGGAGPDPATRPDNPQLLAELPTFVLPLDGIRFVPERDSLLPGTPRVYRYGIHHGLDLYSGVAGADVPYGAPVHAVAAGVVIRADHGYQELTPARWSELTALCAGLHETPPEVEDLFRGRQVLVDHGDGWVTRYVHLSGIPDEIVSGTGVTAGQVIGYVGNSGTEDGAQGTHSGAHLHLDVLLDGHYLGQGLSLLETRRLLQRLLFP
jgi:murein DD-endopeptidase MepM/ murein hydrolase activator NlpD